MITLAEQIAALEPHVVGNPGAMLVLAGMLRQDGQEDRALAMWRQALALAPEDPRFHAEARAFAVRGVPSWHFSIVRDDARNDAYDAALRRAVTPGARVLEIGTGSGLLAMMAARAGAAEVVTCEMAPAVAEKAREIVAFNGYADRVRVLAKPSKTLDAELDLGGPADILVSEIIGNDLLHQDVLGAHEHAVRSLLKPGAQVIPARGTIRVALAHDLRDGSYRMGSVAGFDLSPFNAFAGGARRIQVGDERLVLRGEARDLFTFDLASAGYRRPERTAVSCRSTGGRVSGIAQWIALDLDAATRYENRPAPGARSCWAVLFHPLGSPVDTAPGDEVRVGGAHDRSQLIVWREA